VFGRPCPHPTGWAANILFIAPGNGRMRSRTVGGPCRLRALHMTVTASTARSRVSPSAMTPCRSPSVRHAETADRFSLRRANLHSDHLFKQRAIRLKAAPANLGQCRCDRRQGATGSLRRHPPSPISTRPQPCLVSSASRRAPLAETRFGGRHVCARTSPRHRRLRFARAAFLVRVSGRCRYLRSCFRLESARSSVGPSGQNAWPSRCANWLVPRYVGYARVRAPASWGDPGSESCSRRAAPGCHLTWPSRRWRARRQPLPARETEARPVVILLFHCLPQGAGGAPPSRASAAALSIRA